MSHLRHLILFLSLPFILMGKETQWMESIPDHTSIAELSIPGTHNSATGTVRPSPLASLATTQTLNLREQLAAGIRAFDLRVDLEGNKLQLCHGSGMTRFDANLSLVEACRTFCTFLNTHPAETILVLVKDEDNNAATSQALESYFRTQTQLFYLKDRIPTLHEVRGKCVLLRRYRGTLGINVRDGWKNNDDSELRNGTLIADTYQVPYNRVHEKCRLVDAALTRISKQKHPTLALTFNSVAVDTKLTPPRAFAETCNPTLLRTLKRLPASQRLGILFLDYPERTKGLVDEIIRHNVN